MKVSNSIDGRKWVQWYNTVHVSLRLIDCLMLSCHGRLQGGNVCAQFIYFNHLIVSMHQPPHYNHGIILLWLQPTGTPY